MYATPDGKYLHDFRKLSPKTRCQLLKETFGYVIFLSWCNLMLTSSHNRQFTLPAEKHSSIHHFIPCRSDFDSCQTSFSLNMLGFVYKQQTFRTCAEIYMGSYFYQAGMLALVLLGGLHGKVETSASIDNKMAAGRQSCQNMSAFPDRKYLHVFNYVACKT